MSYRAAEHSAARQDTGEGLNAHVKVNVVIQLESEDSAAGPNAAEAIMARYPLQAHHAGVVEVADVAEGERVIEALGNHIRTTFAQMGVRPLPPGQHKPDLAAAFGGDPEPSRCTCGHGAGYHGFKGSPAGFGGEGPCWAQAVDKRCACLAYTGVAL